jgi:hypothetical protein
VKGTQAKQTIVSPRGFQSRLIRRLLLQYGRLVLDFYNGRAAFTGRGSPFAEYRLNSAPRPVTIVIEGQQ